MWIDVSEDSRLIINFSKIVLIMENKSSQPDIAHNSVNSSNNEQRNRTNWAFSLRADPQASDQIR